MAKKVLLVGHCGADSSYMRMVVRSAGTSAQVIAAVVVGGVAISGGRGTLVGTLIGVALLGSIGPALVYLQTKPQWEKAIQGLIILLAVASDALYREGK